jgi:single-strand DNA-binding protein
MRNQFNGTGRLTADPELRQTSTGKAVAQFTIAINEGRDKDGNDRPATFVRCEAWNGTAENITKYFEKGKLIEVQGRLVNESWEDKATGEKKYGTKISVDRFEFPLTEKAKPSQEGQESEEGQEQEAQPAPVKRSSRKRTTAPKATDEGFEGGEDSDIPF